MIDDEPELEKVQEPANLRKHPLHDISGNGEPRSETLSDMLYLHDFGNRYVPLLWC
jgi:hypothetical protein